MAQGKRGKPSMSAVPAALDFVPVFSKPKRKMSAKPESIWTLDDNTKSTPSFLNMLPLDILDVNDPSLPQAGPSSEVRYITQFI